MNPVYRIHAFAKRAGVTVKALRHYDRVGLLTPERTDAGYRVYIDADLLRLQQIVALKLVGLSLEQIRLVLEDGVLPLGEALQAQQAALRDRRAHIDRALAALERAQMTLSTHTASDAAVLTHLIEELATPAVDRLRKYFSDDAWERWRARHRSWPSHEWRDLYREVQASLDEDTASPHAQELVRRTIALFEAETQGDPRIRTALRKAANDREEWTALLHAAMPGIDVEGVGRFLAAAAWAKWDAPDGTTYDTPTARPRASAAHTALFREFEAVLGDDPHGERVQRVMAKWNALLDEECGGDVRIRAEMVRAGDRWRNWPPGMRRWIAYTHDVPVGTWERVMELISAARA